MEISIESLLREIEDLKDRIKKLEAALHNLVDYHSTDYDEIPEVEEARKALGVKS